MKKKEQYLYINIFVTNKLNEEPMNNKFPVNIFVYKYAAVKYFLILFWT